MLVKNLHFFLIIVLYPSFLFSQQTISIRPVLYSDYEAFLVEPEYNFYPDWFLVDQEFLDTNELLYMSFDQLCVDSSLLIDTIYSYNCRSRSGVVNYRRSFSYDKKFRINSIIAEVQIDSIWLIHQITNFSYDVYSKIAQINYIQYEDPSDSLIIMYKYKDNGLVSEEEAVGKKRSDSTWSKMWLKTYQWVGRRLLSYDYIDIDKSFSWRQNRVEFLYNQKNLPIESVEYEFINNSLEEKYKHTWKYETSNILREHNVHQWEKYKWTLIFKEVFEYDIYYRLIEMQQITFETKDSIPFNFINKYFYTNSADTKIDYVKSKKREFEIESLDGLSYTIIIRDSRDLFDSSFHYSRSGNISGGRKVVVDRDKSKNIKSIRDENWQKDKWNYVRSMKVIYKRKKF